jgi:hypothetical protein
VDSGSQLKYDEFKGLTQKTGITLHHTGVESHNSLWLLERYHDGIRRVYEKVTKANPTLDPDMALSCAVKAANDVTGPNGICPTTLLFGIYPAIDSQLPPSQQNRDEVLRDARAAMKQIFASRKIKESLRARVPASADEVYASGSLAMLHREGPPKQWTGPYMVHSVAGRNIVLVDDNGNLITHSVTQAKPYVPGQTRQLIQPLPLVPDSSHNTDDPQSRFDTQGYQQARIPLSTIHLFSSIRLSKPSEAARDTTGYT